ncbi:MAG: hypothetical protein WD737_02230 [Gemmatimonadota bacterium]
MTQDRIDVNPARDRSPFAYTPSPVVRDEHAESQLTRLLEQQAAKLPSDVFLFAAIAAMGAAVALELVGHPRMSRFVGMWPPALLTMGMYNKLVKVLGPR